MNAIIEQSLISKLRVLSPDQVAEVEDFVEFLAAKSKKRAALERLLAIAPAIEAAGGASTASAPSEALMNAETMAAVKTLRRARSEGAGQHR